MEKGQRFLPSWVPWISLYVREALVTVDGHTMTPADLSCFRKAELLKDLVEWRWCDSTTLDFRCMAASFPLPPRPAEQFLRLFYIVVANFPDVVRRPPEPATLTMANCSTT